MSTKKQPKPTAKPAAPAPSTASNAIPFWQYLLLVAVPFAVYAQTLGFDFVFHDDDVMILENGEQLKKGFDWAFIFNTDAWFTAKQIELYRPWQSLTYWIDFQLGKADPYIYHLHNLLIFSAIPLLLFVFLRRFFPKGNVAFWAALLYPLTMLNIHAVSWIPARGDLYLCLFGLSNLLFLLRFLEKKSLADAALSILFFGLALLSKESAIGLVPVWAVIIWLNRSDYWANTRNALIGYFAVSAVVFFIYNKMRVSAIATASGSISAAAFFRNLQGLAEELTKMLLPVGFSVMPVYQIALTLVGAALWGGIIWAAYAKKLLQDRTFLIGLALTFSLLLPSMAYKPTFTSTAYDYLDHRAYFGFLGVWMVLVRIGDAFGIFDKNWFPAAAIAAAVLFAGVDFAQAKNYKNWEAYYQNALKNDPNSNLANINYGSLLNQNGRPEEGLPYLQAAVKRAPHDADATVRLMDILFKLNKTDEIIQLATQHLQQYPKSLKRAEVFQFRGCAYGIKNDDPKALADFEAVAALSPDNAENLKNKGLVLKKLGRLEAAAKDFSESLRLNPDQPALLSERGFCYGSLGKFPEALADYEQLTKLEPQNGNAWFFVGQAHINMQKLDAACTAFKKGGDLGQVDAKNAYARMCGGR